MLEDKITSISFSQVHEERTFVQIQLLLINQIQV